MDKIQIIEKLFKYILVYSFLLLPIALIFSRYKKNRLFAVLAVYGIVFFAFLTFYYDIPKSYRKLQQAVYTALEFSVFSFIIWHSVENKRIKNIIRSFSLAFIAFQIFYFIISKPQRYIDSVPIAVETILLFVFAFLYFQQYFKYNLSLNIYEYASFWLVVGILIYLGSSFFFNILANHVTDEQMDSYWHFTYIPEILKNILYAFVIAGLPFKQIGAAKTKKLDIPNLDMI